MRVSKGWERGEKVQKILKLQNFVFKRIAALSIVRLLQFADNLFR